MEQLILTFFEDNKSKEINHYLNESLKALVCSEGFKDLKPVEKDNLVCMGQSIQALFKSIDLNL